MIYSIYDLLKRRATPEAAMLLVILGVSSYMLLESFSFRYEAGIFPRFAAAVTVVGATLLLLQNRLPRSLQEMVSESAGLFDQYNQELSGSNDTADGETDVPDGVASSQSPSSTEEDQKRQSILVGLLAGYGILGYLIGLIWATPLFILAFSILFKLPRYRSIAMVVIGLVIALAFNAILPVDMSEGVFIY